MIMSSLPPSMRVYIAFYLALREEKIKEIQLSTNL